MLIDQRRPLVASHRTHVIDTLTYYRASKGDMSYYVIAKHPRPVAQPTLAIRNNLKQIEAPSGHAAYRIYWIASRCPTPAVPERVAPASARQSGPVHALLHQERRWRRRRFLYRGRRTHHRKKEALNYGLRSRVRLPMLLVAVFGRAPPDPPQGRHWNLASIGLCFFLQLQDTRPYLVERLVGSVIEQRIITAGQGRSQLRPVLGL